MKKCFYAFLTLFLLFSCSKNNNDQNANTKKLKIVTTIYPLYSIAKEIGQDLVDIDYIVPKNVDLHEYEVVPQDMKKIEDANIIFFINEEMDGWIYTPNTDKTFFEMQNAVGKTEFTLEDLKANNVFYDAHHHEHEETSLSLHAKDYENFDESSFDTLLASGVPESEHLWMSFSGIRDISKAVVFILTSIDEKNIDIYNANYKAYIKKVNTLESKAAKQVSKLVCPRVFEFHPAFTTLLHEVGILSLGAFQEHESESSINISAKRMKDLIDIARNTNTNIVLVGNTMNQAVVDNFFNSLDTMGHSVITFENAEEGKTHLEMIKANLDIVIDALQTYQDNCGIDD